MNGLCENDVGGEGRCSKGKRKAASFTGRNASKPHVTQVGNAKGAGDVQQSFLLLKQNNQGKTMDFRTQTVSNGHPVTPRRRRGNPRPRASCGTGRFSESGAMHTDFRKRAPNDKVRTALERIACSYAVPSCLASAAASPASLDSRLSRLLCNLALGAFGASGAVDTFAHAEHGHCPARPKGGYEATHAHKRTNRHTRSNRS